MRLRWVMTNWYIGLAHALDYSKDGGRGLLLSVNQRYDDSHNIKMVYGPEVLGLVLPGVIPSSIIDQMIGAPLEMFAEIDFDDPSLAAGVHSLRGAYISEVQTADCNGPCTIVYCRCDREA